MTNKLFSVALLFALLSVAFASNGKKLKLDFISVFLQMSTRRFLFCLLPCSSNPRHRDWPSNTRSNFQLPPLNQPERFTAPLLGGSKEIALDDEGMLVAARAGFAQLKAASNSIEPLRFSGASLEESIVSARVQVVSGLKYTITMDLATGDSVHRHELQVWSQPWTHTLKLTAHRALAADE